GDEIAKVRIDRFREEYPDAKVTFSESGFEAQPFLSALASGEPPDMVNMPRNTIGTFIARGVLAPLDDCIAQEGIDMGVFYDSAVQQVTVDGTAYALPEFLNSRIWILSNPAFEEAGLDPETIDLSDWDAIADANEQLTKMDGNRLNRIGIDPKLPEFLPLWTWANDSPMISEDGLQSQLEAPGVAEALEFSNGLHEAAGGRTKFLDFRDTWDFFGEENQFVADQLAANPFEQWYLNVLADVSPNVDITVRPFETRGGEPFTWSDGNAWAIPAEASNPEAACAFISTMTNAETWIEAAELRAKNRKQDKEPNLGVYTANREADEVIFEGLNLDKWPNLEQAVQTVLDVQESGRSIPPSPAAAAYETAWTTAVNEVMTGGGEPAAALEAADQEAQEAIEAAAR
ncbi:MAG: extracellular solute-binding protein, partial [Actinomycetota bacterium]|nr:extracellular solute-binding protein [Actinomycetota bacterium]